MFSHNYKANMLRSVAIFFGFSEGFAVVMGLHCFYGEGGAHSNQFLVVLY